MTINERLDQVLNDMESLRDALDELHAELVEMNEELEEGLNDN